MDTLLIALLIALDGALDGALAAGFLMALSTLALAAAASAAGRVCHARAASLSAPRRAPGRRGRHH